MQPDLLAKFASKVQLVKNMLFHVRVELLIGSARKFSTSDPSQLYSCETTRDLIGKHKQNNNIIKVRNNNNNYFSVLTCSALSTLR